MMPILLYYGYCWGLLGRYSLLLQYLFQCNCPPTSEEARYPDEVDVIIPACSYASSTLSPSGNFLYVQEEASSQTTSYFLDLRNQEKRPIFIPVDNTTLFLTDELLFLSLDYGNDDYEGGEYILDRTTGNQYLIKSFVFLRSDAYVDRKPNLDVLASSLREVKDVFLIGNDIIIALALDFYTFPEHNFYIDQTSLPGNENNRAEQFLQHNNIDYHFVPEQFPGEALSPDGRFIARTDGIYLTDSDQRIVDANVAKGFWHPYSGNHFSVRGWFYDGSGVIYTKFLEPCLIEIVGLVYDEPSCFIVVPQPLLKLKVPKGHLEAP
jgi:hypothetical protein